MKPSNYKQHPYDSVLHKNEAETIARNIMVILSRTGDTFRPLTWDEYKAERLKDGSFTESERENFEQVAGFCASQHSVRAFSPSWASVQSSPAS